MACIDICDLTRDYGDGKGIFDISLQVEEGETFGFAGINGAGKTTTIRHLMGFLRPKEGSVMIRGKDCWKSSAELKKIVGYVPGEIAFPDDGTGVSFLKHQMELSGRGDIDYCEYICDKLQLDPTANLKSMSKGMKQKTALVAAFMKKPEILILDEPTTGLDPLMRDAFLELLEEQKAMGHTIFMSSHIFEEMEMSCDRVALIKDGKIATQISMDEIRHNKIKTYQIEFKDFDSYQKFVSMGFHCIHTKPEKFQLQIEIHDEKIVSLMKVLKNLDVFYFKEIKHSLNEYFHQVFKEESKNDQ